MINVMCCFSRCVLFLEIEEEVFSRESLALKGIDGSMSRWGSELAAWSKVPAIVEHEGSFLIDGCSTFMAVVTFSYTAPRATPPCIKVTGPFAFWTSINSLG